MRLGLPTADSPDVAEVTARVGFDRPNLFLILRRDELEPVSPELPAVGQRVGKLDVQDAAPLPVSPPPVGRV